MERVGFQNFVEDEACLEEELLGVTAPLIRVLSSPRHKGLGLTFRPVHLRLFRSRRLVQYFGYFKKLS